MTCEEEKKQKTSFGGFNILRSMPPKATSTPALPAFQFYEPIKIRFSLMLLWFVFCALEAQNLSYETWLSTTPARD